MSDTWFISDTHFGHANILTFEPEARAFANIELMNEAIITRWNSVVKKHDKVFHLGDLAFGRDNIRLAQFLNGQKRLVLGNHDKYTTQDYLQHFLSVHGALFWERCVLTHIPVHEDQLKHRSVLNLHGHLHSKIVMRQIHDCIFPDDRYFNVSCEQNHLTPISADIVLERIKKLQKKSILYGSESNPDM